VVTKDEKNAAVQRLRMKFPLSHREASEIIDRVPDYERAAIQVEAAFAAHVPPLDVVGCSLLDAQRRARHDFEEAIPFVKTRTGKVLVNALGVACLVVDAGKMVANAVGTVIESARLLRRGHRR
jgi:hypothetical protein